MQKTLTRKIPVWAAVTVSSAVLVGTLVLGLGGIEGVTATIEALTNAAPAEPSAPLPVAKPILSNAPLADAR